MVFQRSSFLYAMETVADHLGGRINSAGRCVFAPDQTPLIWQLPAAGWTRSGGSNTNQ